MHYLIFSGRPVKTSAACLVIEKFDLDPERSNSLPRLPSSLARPGHVNECVRQDSNLQPTGYGPCTPIGSQSYLGGDEVVARVETTEQLTSVACRRELNPQRIKGVRPLCCDLRAPVRLSTVQRTHGKFQAETALDRFQSHRFSSCPARCGLSTRQAP